MAGSIVDGQTAFKWDVRQESADLAGVFEFGQDSRELYHRS